MVTVPSKRGSQVRVSTVSPLAGWPGRYIYKCAALWGAVYGDSGTKIPLGTIRKEKGNSSRFRVSASSRFDRSY